jgi:hypothetical protein
MWVSKEDDTESTLVAFIKWLAKGIAYIVGMTVFCIGVATIYTDIIGYDDRAEAAIRNINIPGSNKSIRVEQTCWTDGIRKYRIVIPKGYFKTGLQTVNLENKLYCFLEIMETREPFEPRRPLKTHLIKITDYEPYTKLTKSMSFIVEQEY